MTISEYCILSLSLLHTLSLILSLIHIYSRYLSLFHTHTHPLSLSLSHLLSLIHIFSLALSVSYLRDQFLFPPMIHSIFSLILFPWLAFSLSPTNYIPLCPPLRLTHPLCLTHPPSPTHPHPSRSSEAEVCLRQISSHNDLFPPL